MSTVVTHTCIILIEIFKKNGTTKRGLSTDSSQHATSIFATEIDAVATSADDHLFGVLKKNDIRIFLSTVKSSFFFFFKNLH